MQILKVKGLEQQADMLKKGLCTRYFVEKRYLHLECCEQLLTINLGLNLGRVFVLSDLPPYCRRQGSVIHFCFLEEELLLELLASKSLGGICQSNGSAPVLVVL